MTDLLIDNPSLKMEFLKSDSLPDLLSLQAIIAENLPCAEVFLLHDEDFFRQVLCHSYSTIGLFAREKLIAYSISRFPDDFGEDEVYNLGREINLEEAELKRVAILQAIAVHPAYRGRGLQRVLANTHINISERQGCRHICCTVSPCNPISLANMLSCSLLIEALRPKFRGWWRFILHKDLANPNPFPASGIEEIMEPIDQCALSISDLYSQLRLLEKGFRGFRVKLKPGGSEVFYGKPQQGEPDL